MVALDVAIECVLKEPVLLLELPLFLMNWEQNPVSLPFMRTTFLLKDK